MSKTTTFTASNNHEVTVDARLWGEAQKLTEGRGDGRLGEGDARALFSIVAGDNNYSDIEKKTLKHIRAHFNWTAKGDTTFRDLVREAASGGWDAADMETTTFTSESGNEVNVALGLWSAATRLTAGRGDGRIGAADAEELFEMVAGDGNYSDLEKKTLGHIRKHFKWTAKGDDAFRKLVRTAAAKGWDVDGLD
ncbi:MAG: putative tellurite resistance protein B-like protein [Myxococcota bacterium]|jgi:uncharacterized tellurite resistance protein B-like protein